MKEFNPTFPDICYMREAIHLPRILFAMGEAIQLYTIVEICLSFQRYSYIILVHVTYNLMSSMSYILQLTITF